MIIGENAVYSLMERLSPLDYGGGFWDFSEHEGKPLFLAPRSKSRYRITGEITGEITGLQGEVSAEAAGIIATLFAFSHLSFQYQSEHLSDGYGRLYSYSADHAEAAQIFQAID
ncbi:hypothetical protein M2315_004292 [Agrobacterium fabrum]|nr:hypothetical protein [Agrobacterium fabrum]